MNTREAISIYSGERYGKRLLKSWNEYAKLVAEAYAEAPSYEGSVQGAWDALVPWIDKMFNQIFTSTGAPGKINVEFVHDQPYVDDKGVREDIDKNNLLMVSTEYNNHPVWTPETNAKFRAIHDKMAHYDAKTEFTVSGEIQAYNSHIKTCPRNGIPALFTEVVGQACYYFTKGGFPEQKVTFLHGFDYINLGVVKGYDIQEKELRKQSYYVKALDATLPNPKTSPDGAFKKPQPIDENKVDQSVQKMMDSVQKEVQVAPGQELDYLEQLQMAIQENMQKMNEKAVQQSKDLLKQPNQQVQV